jgi:endonuclease YncB( thermonuclease family)
VPRGNRSPLKLVYSDTRAGRLKRKVRRTKRRSWPVVIKGLIAGAAGAVLFGLFFVERFPEYAGPLVALVSTETVEGRVMRVRDGDTIEVSGVPIRFGSLDCAERGTSRGRIATSRMQSLILGQRLTCHLNGRTSYDRKIGSCMMQDGRDLASVMIKEGVCHRYW